MRDTQLPPLSDDIAASARDIVPRRTSIRPARALQFGKFSATTSALVFLHSRFGGSALFPTSSCVELSDKSAVDLGIMIGNADALLSAVKFDSTGLVPVIAQDRATGVVRMLAWANAEALRATVRNGLATFWSRSRNELWEKGKTSGNSMRVHEVRLDCDGDAILYVVDANGPSCHTNATSCFFRSVTASGLAADDGPAPAAAK
jgi:phosphoribosyl-AMP cyclohydrolase